MKRITAALTLCSMLLMLCSCGSKSFSDNPDAMAEASVSILTIEVYDKADNLLGNGSGFVAFNSNTVVTNFHVINEAYRISVIDENENISAATHILAYDKELDIALLEIDTTENYEPLDLLSDDMPQKGETVVAIGSPLGISNTISNGMLSGFVEIRGSRYIQFSAPVSKGSSGGALFNDAGILIGVTSASLSKGQNMNLAIPISYVIDLHNSEKNEKQSIEDFYSVQHPYIAFDEYYVGVRTISIMPEIYDSVESWEKAKTYAETIYNEWLSGEATEDSFVNICDNYGAEQGGGQLYVILPGEFVEEIDEWCFDRTRRVGDTVIIENPYGYSVVFFSGTVIKDSEASDFLGRKAAEQALETDRQWGPDAYGGSSWLNERLSKSGG